MRSLLRNEWVLLGLRLAVGLLFIYASVPKLVGPEEFYRIITGYQIVPWSIATILAIWLPWIQLSVGAMLAIGIWPRASALFLAALTFIFMVAIAAALARGIDLECGCFSVSRQAAKRTWLTLWQEGALLGGCLWLWWAYWPHGQQAVPAR